MKTFTDLIRARPVLAIVLSVVIVIAGLNAWRTLSVRQYPRSDNAVVNVSTVYVGASADVVRGFVTSAIERSIASVDGIEYVESKSLLGLSLVTRTAQNQLRHDQSARRHHREGESGAQRAASGSGDSCDQRGRSADSDFAAAYLSFSSKTRSQSEITDYLVRSVQPQAGRPFGRAGDPDLRRAHVRHAGLARAGPHGRARREPGGRARGARGEQLPRRPSAARKAPSCRSISRRILICTRRSNSSELVIRRENDTIVRLQDVARGRARRRGLRHQCRYERRVGGVPRYSAAADANTIEVVDLVRADLEKIRSDLPAGIEAAIAYDASEYVSNAISEVEAR